VFTVNWNQIRPINGSQQEGFEELVCQLARYEPAPGAVFWRKGKPDGGVECYWTFPDGSEWGWQAKFFDRSPNSNQWGELDESIKQFLKTHPQMTKCTVALPLDLPDARLPQQKSAKQKWDERVAKWQKWARKQGRSVEFEYWGSSELLDRLSQEQHRGRCFFWFQHKFFNQQWFTQRIEESIADAGARYTPELDVKLPIAQVFDGLGRTDAFYARLKGWVARIRKDLPSSNRIREYSPKIHEALQELHARANALCQTLSAIDEESVALLDWQHIINLIEQAQSQRRICDDVVAEEGQRIRADKQLEESSPQYQPKPAEWVDYMSYDLRRLGDVLFNTQQFIESEEARLANAGVLLLVGGAGKGKTHLFCDIASQRDAAQLPTILLLGEHFSGDVWKQMVELLDLAGHSREDLLGALEAAAQVRGRKALILIDALNDSADPMMWHRRLRSFLQVIARYEWISVAISVRSSYEDVVIPTDIGKDQIVRIEHRGFESVEYEAMRRFFDHYGIEQPSVPPLNPEFQTPLFLKIFCAGLRNEGLTRIPKGLHGITAIFDFFVASIYKRLQSPDKLNLSPHSDVVRRVIDQITTIMAERMTYWLPIAEAEQIINAALPRRGYTDSLFYHLLSEGLLAKDRFRAEDDALVEGVSFAYQRLADHLVAQHLLDRYLTDNPVDTFTADTPLRTLMQERDNWWQPQARGLIEALSIQIPERTGRELMSLVHELADNEYICWAFIESVLWRDPKAISDETLDCVNHCVRHEDLHERFLNVLLTVAVDPVHPYNADFLHRHLMIDEMAKRDAWWSIYLYEQYGEKGAVDRLVDWAWAANDKSRVEDESIRLCAVALAWFLTTSHRFLRDRATKALVNLLTDRLHVLRALLQQFRKVNDLYVLERLLAVAYGCALRSVNDEQIGALAQDIYDWLFSDGRPPAHILLRDYARGVVEYALHRGLTITGDVAKVRPPYQSDWVKIPTNEEIDAIEIPGVTWESSGGEWAQNWIIYSVMSWDFAHYVIGTDLRHSHWLSRRLNEPLWQSAQDVQDELIDSLTSEQREAWDLYEDARRTLAAKSRLVFANIPEDVLRQIEAAEDSVDGQEHKLLVQQVLRELDEEEISQLERQIALAEERFCQLLDDVKLHTYKERIKPFLENSSLREDEPRFDMSQVQRWIVKRVFDMGWTAERFGLFDKYHGHDQRTAYKPERIGKKYQWIAYHEIIARLADNFQFREPYSHHADRRQYRGTWQLHVRDIDPACVLKSKSENVDSTATWWVPCMYASWASPADDVAWMKSNDDLPDIPSLIDIVNPQDNSRWLTLYGFYKWEQPIPPDQDRYETSRREIGYFVQGYLVHKADIDEVYNWATQQDFMGDWMPKGRDFHGLYFGELYWSPAYKYHDDPSMGHLYWQTVVSRLNGQTSKPILPLSESYNAEHGTLDCSIDEGYSVTVPVKQLIDEMGLHWNGIEGCFFDKAGRLIALDPSVRKPGPSVLLIRRDSFLEFLDKHGYAVMWTLLGERGLIGGDIGPNNWKGDTVISGAYRVVGEKVIGGLSPTFRSPNRE